ncbi:MAG: hypothetical protein ACERK1_08435, partial [Anaerolineales bacterium]
LGCMIGMLGLLAKALTQAPQLESSAHAFDEGMTNARLINFFPSEVIGEVKVVFSTQVVLPASASS